MADSPFPQLGITMRGIKDFIELVRREPENYPAGYNYTRFGTTREVVDHAIKKITSAAGVSYCDLMRSRGSEDVGTPTVFVSHAWKYEFKDVVAALEAWEIKQGGQPAVFWLDVFSNSQHGCIDRPFTWWNDGFVKSVQKIGRTVLVLDWNGPSVVRSFRALQRAWCLVEIHAGISVGVPLDVAFAPSHEKKLWSDIFQPEFVPYILQAVEAVDLQKSSGFHGAECLNREGTCRDVAAGKLPECPNDLNRIKAAVGGEGGGGFSRVNSAIRELVLDWMCASTLELVRLNAAIWKYGGREMAAPEFTLGAARILQARGRLEEAEKYFRQAFKGTASSKFSKTPCLLLLAELADFLRSVGKSDAEASEALAQGLDTACDYKLSPARSPPSDKESAAALYRERATDLIKDMAEAERELREKHPELCALVRERSAKLRAELAL